MKRTAVAVTLLLFVAALAVYVWPTRYRYSAGTNSRPRALLVRVDRFTGAASYLSDTGWTACRDRSIHLPTYEEALREMDSVRSASGLNPR